MCIRDIRHDLLADILFIVLSFGIGLKIHFLAIQIHQIA